MRRRGIGQRLEISDQKVESSERFMSNNNHTIFQNLIVWQRAMELVEEIYRLINFLPKEETYALSDQMRRAVVSIQSNIAEGAGRKQIRILQIFLL